MRRAQTGGGVAQVNGLVWVATGTGFGIFHQTLGHAACWGGAADPDQTNDLEKDAVHIKVNTQAGRSAATISAHQSLSATENTHTKRYAHRMTAPAIATLVSPVAFLPSELLLGHGQGSTLTVELAAPPRA